jgi:very-short-patch-repair endonuclease
MTDISRLPPGTHTLPSGCVVTIRSASLPGAKAGKRAGDLGDKFEALWRIHGDDAFALTREHRFHPVRKWRFDWCHEGTKTAVELDGAVYSGGRHTRGKGFEADAEKRNEAQKMGWVVLVYTAKDLTKTRGPETVRSVIAVLRSRSGGVQPGGRRRG